MPQTQTDAAIMSKRMAVACTYPAAGCASLNSCLRAHMGSTDVIIRLMACTIRVAMYVTVEMLYFGQSGCEVTLLDSQPCQMEGIKIPFQCSDSKPVPNGRN